MKQPAATRQLRRAVSAAAFAVAGLIVAAACAAASADAEGQHAPAAKAGSVAAPASATRFEVETANGRIERVLLYPAGRSDHYVFDHFVDDQDAIRSEARRLATWSAFCEAASLDDATCRQTCGWAEAARPFERVTLWPAKGASRVLSAARQMPLRFNAGADSQSNDRGDCLSPDGRYLSVFAQPDAAGGAGSPLIVQLGKGLPDVRFVGRRSAKTYGGERDYFFAGWLPGAPHTLKFSYGGDEAFDDEAAPAPKSAPRTRR